MRPYPDHRDHTCQAPGTPPAVDHHRARRIVPDQGAAAGKIVNLVRCYSAFRPAIMNNGVDGVDGEGCPDQDKADKLLRPERAPDKQRQPSQTCSWVRCIAESPTSSA